MAEVKTAARQLTLDRVHRASGANMMERDGWVLPANFGDELLEYAAVRELGAGLLDFSARGRLLVTGSEAVLFLNGLITNDMKTLPENRWMPAVFPNVQGRLLANVRVIRIADIAGEKQPQSAFIIDTEPATRDRVLQTIQKFSLAGDFHVNDLSDTTVSLSVQGKDANEKLKSILDIDAAALPENGVGQFLWQGEEITVLRASFTGTLGYDLFLKNSIAEQLWQALVAAGALSVGHDALEILRVEAGVPFYGQDMDDTTVVTETNLDDAVSYTKGCYIGQEIIARIKYRGHVAKKLRGVVLDGPVAITVGERIFSEADKEIGHITSTTYSPHLGRRVALAYIKYDYISAGTAVRINEEMQAQVVDLPFVNQNAEVEVA